MSEPLEDSFIKNILSGIKTVIIPIVVSIVCTPLLSLTAYKGIIQKQPFIDNRNNLSYPLFCTQDSLIDLVFKFSLYDTAFSFGRERFVLMPDPPNFVYVNSTHHSLSGLPDNTIGVRVSHVSNGRYNLLIPLDIKGTNQFQDGKSGALQVLNLNKGYPNIRSYQFTDWFFFNRWKTSLIVLALLLGISFIIRKIKKKKK